MNAFSVFTLLSLSFGLMTCTMAFMEQEEDVMSILETAQYHLGEFQKSVNRVSSIQRSPRTKRDDGRAEERQKMDFLFNSLIDFCVRIQNFGEVTEKSPPEEYQTWTTTDTNATAATNSTSEEYQTWNTTATNGTAATTATSAITTAYTLTNASATPASVKMNEMEDEPWHFPKVRPLRIDSVKDGDQIHLLFHINHSTPVEITRLAAFDMAKTVIDEVDESGRIIQSLSSFNFLTPGYCEKDYEIKNTFLFESLSEPYNSVSLKINVCGENIGRHNKSKRPERFRRQAEVDLVSEDVLLPKFRIDLDSAESITAFPGTNTTVDLSVEPDTMTFMIVSGIFHDRAAKKMVKDEYRLNFNSGNLEIIRQMSRDSPKLFSVNTLHSTNSSTNGTSETDMEDEPENTKTHIPISITLHSNSGPVAGKLYLEAAKLQGEEEQHQLVKRVSVYHVIQIKKPGSRRIFPRRRVYIEDQSTFICTEKGNENQPKIGRHCTLSCGATGRGISDISIFRGDSNGTIYESLSYKMSDRMFTVVDLGTYSSDINGWYVCSVTDGKGNQHTRDLLLNVGAPEIDVNNTSLLDLGNGTTLVVCAVDGKPPMNVSVEIDYSPSQRVRVDDASTSVRTQIEAKDDVLLTVALPTENISHPASSVICIASNDLGSDNHSIELPDVVTIVLDETQKPQIISKESKIVSFDNGTTAVTCTAKGATRLEAVLSSTDNSASFNLDDMRGHVRFQEPIEGGHSVTWLVMQNMNKDNLWLYCVAMNSYGVDFFKLPSQRTFTATV